MALNRRLPPVRQDQFAMVPRPDVPRSRFTSKSGYKTTLDADMLVPIFVDEVLPGDDWRGKAHLFVRMSTPLFPIMDNIEVETFFFFVPCRLVWVNWVKMMGERAAPSDSISFTVPVVPAQNDTASPTTGFTEGELGDYFGLPITGELGVGGKSFNALPFRAYNLIWNEWFRPQDVQASVPCPTDDGPDAVNTDHYYVKWRCKKHDYFTSCLPYPTKANDVPAIPLGQTAPIVTGTEHSTGAASAMLLRNTAGGSVSGFGLGLGTGGTLARNATAFTGVADLYPTNLYADLSQATGATLNAIRLAVATQQLLERDARGGTRYTELLRSHFGVFPQDSRLQRPEYIGGGRFFFQTQAIPQTAPFDDGSSTSPVGELGAASTASGPSEFSYQATEHGYILGLVNITGEVTYQQGVHRMWTRSTRYDFYWPTFAFLGEQAVRNDEIFADGSANDVLTFGYQERWAEYRYRPSRITGKFRSNATGSMDMWHLSEEFASLPALNSTFLAQNTPVDRVVAAGELAAGQQFLLDSVFDISVSRALPMRSIPGLTRF